MSDRDERAVERRAWTGDPEAVERVHMRALRKAVRLHYERLDVPCTEGGLAHGYRGPVPLHDSPVLQCMESACAARDDAPDDAPPCVMDTWGRYCSTCKKSVHVHWVALGPLEARLSDRVLARVSVPERGSRGLQVETL